MLPLRRCKTFPHICNLASHERRELRCPIFYLVQRRCRIRPKIPWTGISISSWIDLGSPIIINVAVNSNLRTVTQFSGATLDLVITKGHFKMTSAITQRHATAPYPILERWQKRAILSASIFLLSSEHTTLPDLVILDTETTWLAPHTHRTHLNLKCNEWVTSETPWT